MINLSKGQQVTVYGKITDVGEIMGYSLDMDKLEQFFGDRNEKIFVSSFCSDDYLQRNCFCKSRVEMEMFTLRTS